MSALKTTQAPALLVGSSADPTWADGERPENDALEIVELDDLDHSLQVEGDPLASLDVLRDVTQRVSAFLERAG